MKIGIQAYVTAYGIDPVTLGKAIEDAGFDSYWAPDHAAVPVAPATPLPLPGGRFPDVYGQMVDPFVSLSVMATATTALRLVTGVCLVPERNPLMLAKLVSSLDLFSGGRVIFGAGTGYVPELTEVFTPHHATPWKLTIESIEAMKLLWTNGRGAYDGDLVRFPEVICDPLPVQRPHPPVVLGARPTPVSARRVAAVADGIYLTVVTPEEVAGARAAITAECERIGRDPAEIEISVSVHDPSPRFQREFGEAGADRLVVMLHNHDGKPLPREEWAGRQMENILAPAPSPEETLRSLERVRELAEL
ncbi:TIGR03619 family F420-dependent LLM class oxidoreductase [Pseudonocardia benzenivorans]|jgi:probable F420-dependent oxidoreductase|uniref:F420-dependent oxidoreductase n=2 Tax=Pseudonocardia TaxID=1847 RepID=F4CP63_PSEUX|nr:TIGR03619 family F420-dependent LLM class oxidoreductase [Pseudonocardia dioxanivorans]AEA23622.1 putative F420-dependent oxidoreductase [Pseudonocardia dioxanivorans CB1190]GJF06000.1 LLM class F420-dependent oxidoreductase [Pseudonocardia sp. D17]